MWRCHPGGASPCPLTGGQSFLHGFGTTEGPHFRPLPPVLHNLLRGGAFERCCVARPRHRRQGLPCECSYFPIPPSQLTGRNGKRRRLKNAIRSEDLASVQNCT